MFESSASVAGQCETDSSLRVIFVTHFDLVESLVDPRGWTNPHLVSRFIANALEEQGVELSYATAGFTNNQRKWFGRKHKFYRHVLKREYLVDRQPAVLRSIGRRLSEQVERSDAQIVFSPSTLPIAYLECRQPIVYWTDATFAGMLDFYPKFTNLCRESIRHGNAMEQAAMDRATLGLYASRWAAQSAIDHYRVDHSKIRVLSRGPNLEIDPSDEEVHGWISDRPRDHCELLFVGNDWQRKGGDFAIAVARCLNVLGLPTRLRVVGQQVEAMADASIDFISVEGFVSKATPTGRERMNQLMRQAHFLLTPSRAECLSITPLEASAFGVPTLGFEVGGTADAIEDNVSGRLFRPYSRPEVWAEYIYALMLRSAAYEPIAWSSYRRYRTRINWSIIGQQLRVLLDETHSIG